MTDDLKALCAELDDINRFYCSNFPDVVSATAKRARVTIERLEKERDDLARASASAAQQAAQAVLEKRAAEARCERMRKALGQLCSITKSLLNHTNPQQVNDGHAQQWFAVFDFIENKCAALASTDATQPSEVETLWRQVERMREALETAKNRIAYLGAACTDPRHFEANEIIFLPLIDNALASTDAKEPNDG